MRLPGLPRRQRRPPRSIAALSREWTVTVPAPEIANVRDAYRELLEWYTRALYDYMAGSGEEALHRAYELSRKAIADDLGLLEMAAVHHEAILRVMPRPLTAEERSRTVRMLENFFVESLSPFEMTHRAFRESNTALRRMNQMLEEEAKRIAHALHDEAGQLLAAVYLAVDQLAADVPDQQRQRLMNVRSLLDQVREQIRQLSHELRPTLLDDLGLIPALEFLAQGMSSRAGIPITIEGSRNGRFTPVVETALYRIVREALSNVLRHSRASHVNVHVERENRNVRCVVRDDGVGFDVNSVFTRKGEKGFGLIGIRERLEGLNGSLEINSTPGRGTELRITIPLEE
jgi:signal transduction histidine kinase